MSDTLGGNEEKARMFSAFREHEDVYCQAAEGGGLVVDEWSNNHFFVDS